MSATLPTFRASMKKVTGINVRNVSNIEGINEESIVIMSAMFPTFRASTKSHW